MSISDGWVNLLPAIGFGGLVAALVTAFVNYVTKEREYYIDISKHKLETISKLKPNVVQLSRYYIQLAQQLSYSIDYGQEFLNYPLCMYFFCNILAIHDKILKKYGLIQLDDLHAEDILASYRTKVMGVLLPGVFDDVEMFELVYILRKDGKTLSYPKFREDIVSVPYKNKLYQKFEHRLWEIISMHENKKNERDKALEKPGTNIANDEAAHYPKDYTHKLKELEKNTILEELEKNTTAYGQLLALEINQLYEVWYKNTGGGTIKKFYNFENLRDDIKEELKSSNRCYFCRISEFDFGKKMAAIRRIFTMGCYGCYLPKTLLRPKKRPVGSPTIG